MPVIEKAEKKELMEYIIIQAMKWFQEQGASEDDMAFFWTWLEKSRPEFAEENNKVQFASDLLTWLQKFKGAARIYFETKKMMADGRRSAVIEVNGQRIEILAEGADSIERSLLPPFMAEHEGGYSYFSEFLELTASRLEAYGRSPVMLNGPIPYPEFWSWFQTAAPWPKFKKLEDDMAASFENRADPAERTKFEKLCKKWDETIKWALGGFAQARVPA